MATISVHAKKDNDIYKLLVSKQVELEKSKIRFFQIVATNNKKKNTIWHHRHHNGKIEFAQGTNGSIIASIKSRDEFGEWMLMETFISFLLRNFKSKIDG